MCGYSQEDWKMFYNNVKSHTAFRRGAFRPITHVIAYPDNNSSAHKQNLNRLVCYLFSSEAIDEPLSTKNLSEYTIVTCLHVAWFYGCKFLAKFRKNCSATVQERTPLSKITSKQKKSCFWLKFLERRILK